MRQNRDGDFERLTRMGFSGIKTFMDLDYVHTKMRGYKPKKPKEKEAVALFLKDFPRRNDSMY